ncbi:HAD hydrolase-like protein [Herbiconiux sp. A18JL235]|uniref:HAD hydrolase-like protein n=1 Tax=Herbiconiux sp. A18JL235 TaxID=3152363 RepID=A0AB39BF35_9MICO
MRARPATEPHGPTPLAIFDLDGTLVDSGANILAGLRATFAALGLPVPDDTELVHYIGPPVRHSFRLRAGLDHADAEEAGRLYGRISDERFRDGVSVYPGVREALDALAENGARLAIATSKPEPQALALLDEHGLSGGFEVVVGYRPTGERESKAEIIREVLDLVAGPGGTAEAAVMVGDREHDLTGASANGIPSVWAGWGYGSPEEGAFATLTAAQPEQLADAVWSVIGPVHRPSR